MRDFLPDTPISRMLMTSSTPRKNGNREKLNVDARLPNNSGMMVVATDPLAICMPMMDWE